jgi:hypothetical protein
VHDATGDFGEDVGKTEATRTVRQSEETVVSAILSAHLLAPVCCEPKLNQPPSMRYSP